MHKSAVLIFIALISGCISLARRPFDVHEGAIRYTNLAGGHYLISGADVSTFQYVGGIYGKDISHVYYAYTAVEGADPISFLFVGGDAGRDSKMVYVAGVRCPDCDVASFRHLSRNWYADKNFMYEGTKRRPDIDQKTFQSFNYWFAKDRTSVFLSGRPILGADAASFKLASCGSSEVNGEDKNRCYWYAHPVPCDCKPHSEGEFVLPPPEISGRQALLGTSGPVSLNFTRSSGELQGLSAGYARILAGRHSVPLTCWNKNRSEPVDFDLDVEPAHIYRLSQKAGTRCEIEVERTALVLGKVGDPEIRIGLTENQEDKSRSTLPDDIRRQLSTKPMSKVELDAGTRKIMVMCREVTRTGVKEKSTYISVQLEPGRIYQLSATFTPPEYRCDAAVALVEESLR